MNSYQQNLFYASYGTQLGEINYGFNEIVDITDILNRNIK